MADNIKNQMRPIARNLKAPPPPKHYAQEPQKQQNHRQEPKIAATFKTNVLVFQSVKKIRISHYENGPFMFCVQIESADSDFQRLVGNLQKNELTPLQNFMRSRQISIGSACLALFEKKIYRVAIARIPHHANDDFFVNFVDYGFNRSIKVDNLFYIPDSFLSQFTYAIPFSLAGCKVKELKVSDKEINFYFRLLTENKLLTLKCVPSDGPPICQYCELYTDNNVNVLDKLKQWDPYESLQFSNQTPLELKSVHDVKVSYVESAQEFYIHIQNPEILKDYDLTSDELFKVNSSHAPVHRNPKLGSCCAVLLGGDYYRGLVVGANKNNHTVQVKIVDFGIIEEIPEKQVHLLIEKFVEKPPQAYSAILKGFEGLEVSENISTQFDIFCGDGRGERKVFRMTIFDTVKNAYIVELEDLSVTPPVNVNKMLLKNSRPLIETIQLENAKKRQKDSRTFDENFDSQQVARNQDRNNSQRGRGNYVNKVSQRNIVPPVNTNNQLDNRQQSPRTHFGKSNKEENSLVVGTYFKSQKEANVWGSKESTPSDHHSTKSSDWEQPKNIAREQSSAVSWNENSESTQNTQKSRNSKSLKQQQNGNAEAVNKKKVSSDLKSGWVSTLLSVNRAFVHYDEHIEGLERILDEMFAFYENNNSRPLLKDYQIGAECAVRSNDGNWYRSKIDTINGDKVKVFHREYGNSETVSKSKIRQLDKKFGKMNDLAVQTFFAIKPSSELDEKSLFNEMTNIFENGAKEFSFKVVQKMNDGLILEPIDPTNNKSVIDELVKMKKAQRISENELQQILDVKANDKPKEQKKERKSPEKPKKAEKNVEAKPAEIQNAVEPQKPAELQKSAEVQKPIELKKSKEIQKSAEVQKPVVVQMPVEVQKPADVQQVKPQEIPVPTLDPKHILVKMAALTSPTDFYVSRVDENASFSQLHNDIQIIASGAPPLTDFEEGTVCLAKQSFDLCWYRAKIIDSDETEQNVMITVRSLDDGKTFSVEDRMFLKMMPTALERKKFFGISCSLAVSIERKCEEEATDLMKNMMNHQLKVVFLNGPEFERKCLVEMFDHNENVADVLVSKKFARRLDMIQGGKCYTSHINSLSSFYLQFETEQLTLDLISQYFEEAGGKFETVDAEPGNIVAALFPEDDNWYRSRIESIEKNGEYMVTFIDYGNTCLVKKIGEIAESAIKELPSMSKHCRLTKPKVIKKFSEAAEQKFINICENGATILEIKSSPLKPGEAAEVEIFLNGKNIADQLIPLCNPFESNDSGLSMSLNEKQYIN